MDTLISHTEDMIDCCIRHENFFTTNIKREVLKKIDDKNIIRIVIIIVAYVLLIIIALSLIVLLVLNCNDFYHL